MMAALKLPFARAGCIVMRASSRGGLLFCGAQSSGAAAGQRRVWRPTGDQRWRQTAQADAHAAIEADGWRSTTAPVPADAGDAVMQSQAYIRRTRASAVITAVAIDAAANVSAFRPINPASNLSLEDQSNAILRSRHRRLGAAREFSVESVPQFSSHRQSA